MIAMMKKKKKKMKEMKMMEERSLNLKVTTLKLHTIIEKSC